MYSGGVMVVICSEMRIRAVFKDVRRRFIEVSTEKLCTVWISWVYIGSIK